MRLQLRQAGNCRDSGVAQTASPVPCMLSAVMLAGASSASSRAARMTACWLGPLGAVSVLLRPPWLTAVPASSTAQPPAVASSLLLIGCSSAETADSERT